MKKKQTTGIQTCWKHVLRSTSCVVTVMLGGPIIIFSKKKKKVIPSPCLNIRHPSVVAYGFEHMRIITRRSNE